MKDKVIFTILEDGTIKIETDKVSMPNHVNAEAFLRECVRLAGGPTERRHKHGGQHHTHSEGEHQHA